MWQEARGKRSAGLFVVLDDDELIDSTPRGGLLCIIVIKCDLGHACLLAHTAAVNSNTAVEDHQLCASKACIQSSTTRSTADVRVTHTQQYRSHPFITLFVLSFIYKICIR